MWKPDHCGHSSFVESSSLSALFCPLCFSFFFFFHFFILFFFSILCNKSTSLRYLASQRERKKIVLLFIFRWTFFLYSVLSSSVHFWSFDFAVTTYSIMKNLNSSLQQSLWEQLYMAFIRQTVLSITFRLN